MQPRCFILKLRQLLNCRFGIDDLTIEINYNGFTMLHLFLNVDTLTRFQLNSAQFQVLRFSLALSGSSSQMPRNSLGSTVSGLTTYTFHQKIEVKLPGAAGMQCRPAQQGKRCAIDLAVFMVKPKPYTPPKMLLILMR